MQLSRDPVDAILAAYGIPGPWESLPATGVANRIYATPDIVLRVAADDPDSIPDARTESVAAPVARAAGILTPQLIAFDDSRSLIDKPFSLWERVRGETLGLLTADASFMCHTWRAAGQQLAALHERVRVCPDPLGFLDQPCREVELEPLLEELAHSGRIEINTAREVEALISELRPHISKPAQKCFLHNDLHAMNVMCSRDGSLLAIIDWGDAGWGDPTLEFAAMPCGAITHALEGYESERPGRLGDYPEARIVWDKLYAAIDNLLEGESSVLPLEQFRALLQHR